MQPLRLLHNLTPGILTLALLFIVIPGAIGQSVKKNGQLSVQGLQLVNEKGSPVVLRGMSFGWHNWWPRFYNGGQ
jgi:endoglucanase